MKYPSASSSKTIATSLTILGLATYASAALAWTGPSASPPSSNASAPINVSATGQTKTGNLTVNSLGTVNGLTVQSGNVGIDNVSPSYPLDVTGTVRATAFLYSSDRRLKTDIAPIADALAKIEQLQGVTFTWKDTGRNDMGLIAQDVQKVFPDVVQQSSTTGLLSLAYGNLVAPLIEAVKSLARHDTAEDAEIASLKATVESQAAAIAELQAQMAQLKSH